MNSVTRPGDGHGDVRDAEDDVLMRWVRVGAVCVPDCDSEERDAECVSDTECVIVGTHHVRVGIRDTVTLRGPAVDDTEVVRLRWAEVHVLEPLPLLEALLSAVMDVVCDPLEVDVVLVALRVCVVVVECDNDEEWVSVADDVVDVDLELVLSWERDNDVVFSGGIVTVVAVAVVDCECVSVALTDTDNVLEYDAEIDSLCVCVTEGLEVSDAVGVYDRVEVFVTEFVPESDALYVSVAVVLMDDDFVGMRVMEVIDVDMEIDELFV